MGNMGTYTGLYGELYEIPWDFYVAFEGLI